MAESFMSGLLNTLANRNYPQEQAQQQAMLQAYQQRQQSAPNVFSQLLGAEKDPFANASLKALEQLYLSPDPNTANQAIKMLDTVLQGRMANYNRTDLAKNADLTGFERTDPRYQEIFRQQLSGYDPYKQQNIDLDRQRLSYQQQIDAQKLAEDARQFNDKIGLDREQMTAKTSSDQAKLSESQKTQMIGVKNTQNAINEYINELSGWSNADMLSPDKLAAMGSKYNNMLLQAKEAYKLGVLNGPDYEILTSIVTNPISMKGALTSNEAMKTQAKELQRILGNVGAVTESAPVRSGASGSWSDNKKPSTPSGWNDQLESEYQAFIKVSKR